MRRFYLDNIRWATVVLVVIYHVFFMYNAEGVAGGFGKITDLPARFRAGLLFYYRQIRC